MPRSQWKTTHFLSNFSFSSFFCIKEAQFIDSTFSKKSLFSYCSFFSFQSSVHDIGANIFDEFN